MSYHSFIMYPTNATTLLLGKKLISSDHDLTFFCPSELHIRQACTMPFELAVFAGTMGRSTHLVQNLDTLHTADFIIFPTLDIDYAEKRENFSKMIKDCLQ